MLWRDLRRGSILFSNRVIEFSLLFSCPLSPSHNSHDLGIFQYHASVITTLPLTLSYQVQFYPSNQHYGTHGEYLSSLKIWARVPLWWSGDCSFEESIPTLHWRPDNRRTEGSSDFVFLIAFLTLCNRRWGELHSSRWTRVNGKLNRGCGGIEVRCRCGNFHTTIWGWRDLEEFVTG